MPRPGPARPGVGYLRAKRVTLRRALNRRMGQAPKGGGHAEPF